MANLSRKKQPSKKKVERKEAAAAKSAPMEHDVPDVKPAVKPTAVDENEVITVKLLAQDGSVRTFFFFDVDSLLFPTWTVLESR
mgnify:CR=1 FL=1